MPLVLLTGIQSANPVIWKGGPQLFIGKGKACFRKLAELEEKKKQWIQYLVILSDGIDDPRITVIKTEPTEGYYWDDKQGNLLPL